jgi:hypothetical protein
MGHDQRRGYKSERLKLSRNSVKGYAFRPNSFLQQGFLRGECRYNLKRRREESL